MDLVISSNMNSPRLQYGIYIIFEVILGWTYRIQISKDTPNNILLIRVKGQNEPFLSLGLHPILFDNGIEPYAFKKNTDQGLPYLFKINNSKSDLPFDLFALAFYLTSRYEEYNTKSTDFIARFQSTDSMAYKHNFLDKPLIDLWAYRLKKLIETKLETTTIVDRQFKFVPTVDIDIAWAFKHKKPHIALGKSIKSLLSFKWRFLKEQILVLWAKNPDPYDQYAFLEKLELCYDINHIYFISIGDRHYLDSPIHYKNDHYKTLIQNLAKDHKIGVHPSYKSNKHPSILKKEIQRLSQITGSSISLSRQHYLKLSFPHTYQHLIAQKITQDYTLGYHDAIGFRASTAQPFLWFDLSKNECTSLLLNPFQVMDVVLKDRLKGLNQAILNQVREMISLTRSVNGHFVSIVHNSSFSPLGGWDTFKNMYKKIIKECNETPMDA